MEMSIRHPITDQAALKAEGLIPVYMPGGSRVVVGYATISEDGTIRIQMRDLDTNDQLISMLSEGAIKGVSFDYQEVTVELVPKKTFMVEHDYLYGWDDALWEFDGKPWRFDSREDAEKAILELCVAASYDPEDYRVVEVKE